MERNVALKKLRKILGDGFGYRLDPKALTAEDRDQAREDAKTLTALYKAADEAETARRQAVLSADAEYQRLRAETKRLRQAKDEAWSTSQQFRVTVGKSSGIFFMVKAQGDSWEDVIEKLTAKADA
jgi:hypothetical protein